MSAASLRAADVVRREWWVVALALLVAIAAGLLLSSGTKATYVGKATIEIDAATVSRNPDLPSPTAVQQAALSEAARAAVSATTGVSATALSSDAKTALFGTPARQIVLQFTSSDRNEALLVADALRQEALLQANELGAAAITRARAFRDETLNAIAVMPQPDTITNPSERASVIYQRWNLNTQLTGFTASLDAIEKAYSAVSPATVSRQSALLSKAKTLAAAALLGLLLGLAVAAVREGLLLRRAHA